MKEIPEFMGAGGASGNNYENFELEDNSIDFTNESADKIAEQISKEYHSENVEADFSIVWGIEEMENEKAIKVFERIFSDKNFSEDKKSLFIYNFIDDFAENFADLSGFFEEFIQKIDLQNKKSEAETKNLLEVLRFMIYAIYAEISYRKESGYGESLEYLIDRLKNKLDRDNNNYFLNLRLKSILKSDVRSSMFGEFSTDKDIFPFQIAPNQIGIFDKKGNLLISSSDEYEKIKDDFKIVNLYKEFRDSEDGYIKTFFEELKKHKYLLDERDRLNIDQDGYYNYEVEYKQTDAQESDFAKGTHYENLNETKKEMEIVEYFLAKYPQLVELMRDKLSREEEKIGSFKELMGEAKLKNKNPDRLEEYDIRPFEKRLLDNLKPIRNSKLINSDNFEDYKYIMSKPIRENLQAEFGFRMQDFSIEEQYYFLQFIKTKAVLEMEGIKNFLNLANGYKDKINRIRSFLSLEHGGQEMGQKILDIGNKFDQETADKIFAKYAQLADYAQDSAKYLSQQFNIQDETQIQKIADHLLRRGKALLSVCAEENLTALQVIEKLEGIKGEVEILSATLKSAKEDGIKINPEIIQGLKIEKRADNLNEKEKKAIVKIFQDNYRKIFADNPQAYQRVEDDFLKELENLQNQMVYIMKFNNEVVAFCRFNPLSDSEVYGGSLNVTEEIQGLNIGGYFICNTLKEVSKNYDIIIKTRKDNPANEKYQKEGFVITGEHQETDGVEYFDMLLPGKNILKKAA